MKRTTGNKRFTLQKSQFKGGHMAEEKAKKETLKSKALILGSIASYQPGAIVSREIIKETAGSVTVFAFDAGQGLSEHTAPFDALVYILDGEAEVRISQKKHRLKDGEFIIMPAHEPHALQAVKAFKMMLVMIKG
jgi:quercetin dioxygenase-like cupin family protein